MATQQECIQHSSNDAPVVEYDPSTPDGSPVNDVTDHMISKVNTIQSDLQQNLKSRVNELKTEIKAELQAFITDGFETLEQETEKNTSKTTGADIEKEMQTFQSLRLD